MENTGKSSKKRDTRKQLRSLAESTLKTLEGEDRPSLKAKQSRLLLKLSEEARKKQQSD
jgi:hypothetical protein